MRLRRYCVTVMDNWTPMRFFWTKYGAALFKAKFCKNCDCAHLYAWRENQWQEVR
jgi:hypothetical protein